MRRLLLVALSALVLAAPAATKEPSFVVRGDHSFAGVGLGAKLADAKKVFGAPNSLRQDHMSCFATWKRYALVVEFFAFEPHPCTAGTVLTATMTSARWHTLSGLHVGDAASTVKTRHPVATLHSDGWWLVTRKVCGLGNFQPYAALLARVRAGHVSALVLSGSVCE
jgi:hypothetical protein